MADTSKTTNATSRDLTGTEKSSADDNQESDEVKRMIGHRNNVQEEMEWRCKDNEDKQHAIEELGHDAEWRVPGVEIRTHESLVQKIDHLFSDDDSPQEEGTSEDEPFRLPDRLSRLLLSSSSSSDKSQIRDQSTQRRKPRRQTRKHREQGRNQEQAVTLFRAPARIHLQGPLARTTQLIIYSKITKELRSHRNRHPSADLFSYLKERFESSRRDDIAVMSLIQGTAEAQYLTGDTQQALTQSKQLKLDMHTCHLTNPGITEARVYWNMCVYYMKIGKPGSAHSALQAAVSSIQHHAPSAWTGQVCDLQGYMFDRLAQVNPGHRREHQDVALRCYTNAIEPFLYQPCQEEDYLYLPILYTTYMIHIKLDMPTVSTISDFPGSSDMVYNRLCEYVVTQGQVTEAQDMLRTVSPHIHTVTAEYRPNMNERVIICDVILNIRLTQLAIIDKEYISGLKYITNGAKLYDDWCDIASRYTNTLYKRYPHLVRDTKKLMDSLHDRLMLMPSTRPAPKPEPLSDSLSSEPSDSLPSGLKQLTDASRRAEKQARGGAYSSGDIDMGNQEDVSTDQN